jgi:hypothetical protein
MIRFLFDFVFFLIVKLHSPLCCCAVYKFNNLNTLIGQLA